MQEVQLESQDKRETDFDHCQNLLRKLKKNKESVHPKLLKTKYAAAYHNLIKEIQTIITRSVKMYLFDGLPLDKMSEKEFSSFLMESQKVINEKTGLLRTLGRIALQEYDLMKVFEAAVPIKDQIMEGPFHQVWDAHCRNKNGCIYNDLIDMVWSLDYQLWVTDDLTSWCLMLPPPEFQN